VVKKIGWPLWEGKSLVCVKLFCLLLTGSFRMELLGGAHGERIMRN
jgi:hypothetical protein